MDSVTAMARLYPVVADERDYAFREVERLRKTVRALTTMKCDKGQRACGAPCCCRDYHADPAVYSDPDVAAVLAALRKEAGEP